MRSRVRNITVTLDETVASWARIEAARKGVSVSRLLADLLRAQMTDEQEYGQAMPEALARGALLQIDRYLPNSRGCS